jgi:general secretion pathway protein A
MSAEVTKEIVTHHASLIPVAERRRSIDGDSLSLTYEPDYGLLEKPFSLSSDPKFLYRSPAHASAFERLHAGIRRREGLIVLTGDIGTGKTTLCRAVLEKLDRRTFSTFIPDPFASREDFLKTLLVDFGVMSTADLRGGRLAGASRAELTYPLYEFLDALVPIQAFAVLVIDEAQHLSLPLLEEIRILSDLERREKLLQVVLVGQPELRSNLKLPQMRQVDQRVSVRCELTALGLTEIRHYINHRLDVASLRERRVEFDESCIQTIAEVSGGVPRVINRICDRALHHGWMTGANHIDADLVRLAVDDLGLVSDDGVPPVDLSTSDDVSRTSSALIPVPVSTSTSASEIGAEERDDFLAEFLSEGEPTPSTAWQPNRRVAAICLGGAMCAALCAWLALNVDTSIDITSLLPAPPPHHVAEFAPVERTAAPLAEEVTPSGRSGQYVIQVAAFEGPVRAERLVEQLIGAGFAARATEIVTSSSEHPWFQVVVGPYTSLEPAETDLARIWDVPGYEDAKVVNASAKW